MIEYDTYPQLNWVHKITRKVLLNLIWISLYDSITTNTVRGKMLKKCFYTDLLVGKIAALLSSLIILTSLSFADTHIPGGNVSGTWTLDNSPYIIDGEIQIPTNDLLIIEPGVQVIFSGHYKSNIYGRLLAVGTIADTITFTIDDTTGFSNPDTTAGGWHGLRFYDIDTNEQDSSKVIYCKLEYGKALGNWPDNEGGAIYCNNSSSVLIKNCLIRNNRADDYGKGGGIYCNESNPSLNNVIISRNYATRSGGGICCDYSNPILQDVIINENSTGSTYYDAGGGVCFYHSSPILDNVIISENNSHYGGGISCQTSSPILANVTIYGNTANCGGGIYADDYSYPCLTNVTISENVAEYGGGISGNQNSSPVLLNCILWNNALEEFYLIYGSTVAVTYSDIMGGWTGECNIDADPLFVDPINGDFHLTEFSPCIDAGDPASPPDPDGTISDMGAYYFHQSDIIPPIADFCADNTTGDAPLIVNFTNLSIPGNGTIISWNWDFGDNTGSAEQNPTHTYDNIGIYTVSLRVIAENNGINTETKIDYITAFGPGLHIPGGNVSGVWVINFSPYIIDGDIEIQSGDSLLIESGIEVLFSDHYKFKVYGRLLAIGTETDTIIFTAQDTLSGWHGLRFYDTDINGQDSSKILYCKLEYGKATGNLPDKCGGAIYLANSSDILIKNCVITKNSADYGGGLSCDNYSSPGLINVTIKGNTASYGGGIHCNNNSYPTLEGVTISENTALFFGGGVYCNDNSGPSFSTLNLCNIFLNYAGLGNDLYALYNCPTIDVIVDTFTVLQPDNNFASPIDNFTFDILHCKVEPVNADLYVSPAGNNNNSGLTPDEPLKTISYALVKIASDETNPHTINLSNGTYSSSQTGEIFPLNCRSYVSIHGEDGISTILDGEEVSGILFCRNDSILFIEDMTIQNGCASLGSGIYCYESSISVKDVTICGNGYFSGRGYSSQERVDEFYPILDGKKLERIFLYRSNNCFNPEDIHLLDYGFIHYNKMNNKNFAIYKEDTLGKERFIPCGAGIFCARSIINLVNVIISGNDAGDNLGGGIYFEYSNASLENVEITGNTGGCGGGIHCFNSSPTLNNVTILENTASNFGGGIYCYNSNPSFTNVTINQNSADCGGGILCDNSNPDLDSVTISENTAVNGGGLYLYESSPILSNSNITENTAKFGGGIAFDNSIINFDTENRCNIYLNYGGTVNDLYANYNCPVIDIIVDTFTVLQPDDYFAYPTNYFTFDILNGKVEPVNQDLYVSPGGSNNNSGLTLNEPLKTISYALVKIAPDTTNPHTIYLSNGTYSSSQTGEIFPLNCRSYVSLNGEDEIYTILDGEELKGILFCRNDSNFSIKNMTIQNGHTTFGGGIICEFSNIDISNAIIKDNFSDYLGGGILFWHSSSSITNVTINGNTADIGRGGGISCDYYSNTFLINVIISNNNSTNGGGISCYDNSITNFTNVTISQNTAIEDGGGIYGSNMNLLNCIYWNNYPQDITSSSVIATYSDIQGEWTGEGNIDANPLFADPGNGDFHLTTDSPCIDAGIPDTTGLNLPPFDLDGYPRIYNGRIDMGAYEWQGFDIDEPHRPVRFTALYQNYPNPFSTFTTISFNLATRLRSASPGQAEIKIYNIKGQIIKTFRIPKSESRTPNVVWNGKDENGKQVPSGIYFYKLNIKNSPIKKMLLLR